MNSTTARSFGWSLALHVSCCVLLCVVVARPLREITPTITPPDFFKLVPSSESVSPSGASGEISPTVRMPELPRTKAVPAVEETQQPSIPQAANPARRPATTTVPSTSQRLSFDQYRKLHGPSTSSPRKPESTTTSKIRRINAGDFAYSGPSAMSPASSSELSESFISGLLSELKRSYSGREAGFAGLSVEVEFVLGTDGRLKAPQVLSSSGQIEFDQAVLEALHHVQLADCPADAVGRRFKTRFVIPNP